MRLSRFSQAFCLILSIVYFVSPAQAEIYELKSPQDISVKPCPPGSSSICLYVNDLEVAKELTLLGRSDVVIEKLLANDAQEALRHQIHRVLDKDWHGADKPSVYLDTSLASFRDAVFSLTP